MRGTAFGVGVGPGDPELITVKAIRLIRETNIIAVPGRNPKEAVAYRIAVQAVPELAEKELIPVEMPMSADRRLLCAAHEQGAKQLEKHLDQGENVVFLTLGDPTLYCTFSYLQRILERDGYPTGLVSGVPSFCAAAARLNLPLCEGDEPLRILPAAYRIGEPLDQGENLVLMKSARHMKAVKERLRQSNKSVQAVIDCGMESEVVCRSLEEIPDEAGYFALIIAK